MIAEGCRLCQKGAKMVLFITGKCARGCWYCPISAGRKGRDLMFANEREISSMAEAIQEARLMSALGTSFTGGEPLMAMEKVAAYARGLKEAFGQKHHIHLYTGEAPGREELLELKGLVDEIRLHPPVEEWARIGESEYLNAVKVARSLGYSAGFEVPSLPELDLLAPALSELDFLNINELEWGELSAAEMRRRGYEPLDDLQNAVKGAVKWAERIRQNPKVHFCTSRFKDSVQLRERLKRIARNTARPFDEITRDGTIRYGVLELASDTVPVSWLEEGSYQKIDGRLEMDWRVLKRHAKRLRGEKYIVERYPNNGIIVEVIPL